MKATQELMKEHDAVLLALKLLDKITARISENSAQQHLVQLLDFFRGFVDQCHHSKEEEVLFPALELRGVARESGPIGVMLSEHEEGRRCVRQMSSALSRMQLGEADAAEDLRKGASQYRALLEAHISKENNILFPMADRLLSADVAEQLFDEFEEIERERIGEGKHEAYHELLHSLKATYLPGKQPSGAPRL